MPELIGSGYIAFTVDQGEDTERYQGIVELAGANLAECAQHYFRQSEQIQAGIKLSVARSGENGAWRAGGLMLQRVPPEGGYTVIADDVEDGWRRAMVLMSSATADELVDPNCRRAGCCSGCSTRTASGCSRPTRWRRAAAARASASPASCARCRGRMSRRCARSR